MNIDHHGVAALFCVDHEAPRIGRDKFSAYRLAQEVAFINAADIRVDVDAGVAIPSPCDSVTAPMKIR